MVHTAVLVLQTSKRLLEGSEGRVRTWADGLGESGNIVNYLVGGKTVQMSIQLNTVVANYYPPPAPIIVNNI